MEPRLSDKSSESDLRSVAGLCTAGGDRLPQCLSFFWPEHERKNHD